MAVVLILVGVIVLVVVCSVIGARRGTPIAFEAFDPETERARGEGQRLHNHTEPPI